MVCFLCSLLELGCLFLLGRFRFLVLAEVGLGFCLGFVSGCFIGCCMLVV